MFESTKDILYIVIAFCALWVTIFLCWVIYYVAMILKQAYGMTNEFKERVAGIDEAIRGILEKIEHSSAYLALIADGAKYLIRHFTEKKESKRGRPRKKIEL
ncbi:hypothetical protein KJ969_02120 [Patescibacteria group bacterium]|nr:hypothetical protein [Patescibacteria group bacterium]MBU1921857.1 hypothetical protein [Patescibacteria group bacterium]